MEPATQIFSGPIIFVSFIISVIGSMTTLELLTRRTHIHGRNNWYLLLSAALSMGSVSIWSMHFIGNNALTLVFPNRPKPYQLAYSGGFTFASLVVSIACMFISFFFVGVTEHVQVYRILLSGVLAGIGIATMHYLGQFAIEYFHVVYKPAYIVAAVIIACTAVTAALWIFFKLRERWMNQWYKRLGCACIMATAVCGMHYTAMVGTEYYDDKNGDPPPIPLLATPVLIGVICAVVVVSCLLLFYVGVKCSLQRISENANKSKKRLVVDLVLFDATGRVMVNIDGVLPSKEVLSDIQFKKTRQEFSSSHPLFIRLFQVVTQWSTTPTLEDYDRTSNSDEFNTAERRFHEATSSLMESLHMDSASELGLLYESVIRTHTVIQPSLFQQKRDAVKNKLKDIRRGSGLHAKHLNDNHTDYGDGYSLSERPPTPTATNHSVWHHDTKKNLSTTSFDQANAMEFTTVGRKKKSSSTIHLDYEQHHTMPQNIGRHTSIIEGDEERHIVLVRQLTNDKDIHRFMTHGYRFADSTFISKIMAAKLHVPNEYLLNHFQDMLLLAQSSLRLTGTTAPRVMVGLLGLVDEGQTYDDVQMIVDKKSRYGFPIVDLIYKDTGEAVRQLLPDEKHCLSYMLHDQPLYHVANIDKYIDLQARSSLTIGRTSTNTLRTMEASRSIASSTGAISNATTIKSNISTTLTTTSLDQELANKHHNHHNQQQSITSITSPVNPTSPTATVQRFAEAMELASQKLMQVAGTNGMHLGLNGAMLQSEVLDLPAFALTAGPCTLILFRTCLRTRGTAAAIQQHATTEPIRSIPYLLGASLAFAVTQRAADQYQKSMTKFSWGTELQQQMLYGSFARSNQNNSAASYYYQQHHRHNDDYADGADGTIPNSSFNDIYNRTKQHADQAYKSNRSTGSNTENNNSHDNNSNSSSSSNRREDGASSPSPPISNSSSTATTLTYHPELFTSLPPPPRIKRSKQPPSIDTTTNGKQSSPTGLTAKYQSMNEMETILNILPPKDRFIWLDQVIVECLHSILS